MTTKRLSAKKQREEFLANVGFIRHRQWDEILADRLTWRVRTRVGVDLGFIYTDHGYTRWGAEGSWQEDQPRAMAGQGGFPTRDEAVLWLGGFDERLR